jgi:hypothetical protein
MRHRYVRPPAETASAASHGRWGRAPGIPSVCRCGVLASTRKRHDGTARNLPAQPAVFFRVFSIGSGHPHPSEDLAIHRSGSRTLSDRYLTSTVSFVVASVPVHGAQPFKAFFMPFYRNLTPTVIFLGAYLRRSLGAPSISFSTVGAGEKRPRESGLESTPVC